MPKEEYRAVIHPLVRRRTVVEQSEVGDICSFCVQLELDHEPSVSAPADWEYIARFDHNPSSPTGHDIREEGLHMDVRHPHGTDRVADGFPPMPVEYAPKYAEEFFDENYLSICKRYMEWRDEKKPGWRATLPLSL